MDIPPDKCAASNPKKGKEGRIIEKELQDFDFNNCVAWKALRTQFSSGIRHPELLSIAAILSKNYELPEVPRSGKRSFKCLIKWFNDNWEKISGIIQYVTLLDEKEIPICGQREYVELYK